MVGKETYERAQQGDEEALAALVAEHTGLVVRVAQRYQGQGLDLEDLRQEGYIGLLDAIRGFRPAMGYAFSSYATPAIERQIQHALRKWNGKGKDHGPSSKSCEDFEFEDLLRAPTEEAAQLAIRMEPALERLRALSGLQRVVLVERYGLADDRPQSYEGIAAALGISAEEVVGLESEALAKLRGDGGVGHFKS